VQQIIPLDAHSRYSEYGTALKNIRRETVRQWISQQVPAAVHSNRPGRYESPVYNNKAVTFQLVICAPEHATLGLSTEYSTRDINLSYVSVARQDIKVQPWKWLSHGVSRYQVTVDVGYRISDPSHDHFPGTPIACLFFAVAIRR